MDVDSHPELRDATTLAGVLRRRAREHGERTLYHFLPDGERVARTATYAELDLQARRIAATLVDRGAAGQPVLLVYPEGIDFVAALFGCFYAGAIATPVSPPRRNRKAARLESVLADSGATLALVDPSTYAALADTIHSQPQLKSLRWLRHDLAAAADPLPGAQELEEPTAPALLQYTSGSTGRPKGVVVSHTNLLENQRLIGAAFQQDSSIVVAGWLPAFHDMGLVGNLLHPLALGGSLALMPPMAFLQKPIRWLRTISAFRATVAGGPNFAFDLCVDETTPAEREGLDLRSLQVLFNGSEPVRASSIRRFVECFAPYGLRPEAVSPCYGMAETTLLVSGSRPGTAPLEVEADATALAEGRLCGASGPDAPTRALVASGPVDRRVRIEIVDPQTRCRKGAGQIGEIWLAGATVAQGYWRNAEATVETFAARLADEPAAGPFLRTGDMGVLVGSVSPGDGRQAGELLVTGRLKELLILRGANHYPHDLEATARAAHPALASGTGAAVALDTPEGERAALVHEVERAWVRPLAVNPAEAEEITASVRAAIVEEHQIELARIVLVRPGAVPRTTSGKTQRNAVRQLLLTEGLEPLVDWRPGTPSAESPPAATFADAFQASTTAELRATDPRVAELEAWLTARVVERAGLPLGAIDRQTPFAQFGLGSLAAVRLSGQLSEHLGRHVAATVAYDYPSISALASHLVLGERAAPATVVHPLGSQEPLAVIGMACRAPGAESADALWRMLIEGRSGIGPTPGARWPRRPWSAEAPARGGYLESIDGFDPDLFGISPREAERIDPQQRLWLEVVWEALENAGVDPTRLSGSATGVFAGVSAGDYALLQADAHAEPNPYAATGASSAILANRTSYLFDLRGPSLTIDTACSSSLVTLHQAAQALRRGECDLAIVGGVNLILSDYGTVSLARAGMLSADGVCRAFDAGANGFVRGEGCGVVVLKPLAAALAAGDRVWAVVRGSAINQDGRSNGLTAPSGPAQQAVVRSALAAGSVDPETIGYVEAHGTGTELGDPTELGALAAVFGERTAPLLVGSVKTNLGHLEAAAGIAGFIKTCLALHHGVLPASLNFDRPSRHFDWKSTPLEVVAQSSAWPQHAGRPRRAGVSSFGFGGANAHVVLEEAPAVGPSRQEPSRPVWIVLSARSPAALRALAARWAETVTPSTVLADFAVAAARRAAMACRAALYVADHADLKRQLEAIAKGAKHLPADPPTEPPASLSGWLDGKDVDLSEIVPSAPFRAALPSYPFERTRYWFESDLDGKQKASELLGRPVELAGETRVFEADLGSIGWLADHRVDGQGVFPATGYVEIALAAARLLDPDGANESPAGRVEVCDLSITERTTLGAGVRMQTHALREADGWRLTFHRREAEGWTQTASCRFHKSVGALPLLPVRGGPTSPLLVKDLYARCADAGIDYGPGFQRVLRVSASDSAAEGLLEFDPAVDGVATFLDAALQLTAATLPDDCRDFWAPVAIGAVRCALPADAAELRCQVSASVQGENLTADVRIETSSGSEVASLRGVKLRRAGAERAPYYRLEWVPMPRVDHTRVPLPRVDLSLAANRAAVLSTSPMVRARTAALGALEEIALLAAAEAVASFADAQGRLIGLQAQVSPVHLRLFDRLLLELAERGEIERDGDGWRLRGEKAIVAGRAVKALEHARAQHHAAGPELDVLAACVPHLAEVLRGRCDPLPLLFPPTGRGAADLYRNSLGAQALNELVADAIESVAAELPVGRALWVLEIGAGSGATAEAIFRRPVAERLRYTFTDIAPAFLSAARGRFAGKDYVEYRVLDIEGDLAAQGFDPAIDPTQGWDVVLAANVLHATADLSATLQNVHRLLNPGGLLVLVEGLRPLLWLDATFGMLEGWWRAADTTRHGYPLQSAECWERSLQAAGFGEASLLRIDGDIASVEPAAGPENGVLIARADKPTPEISARPALELIAWTDADSEPLAQALSVAGALVDRRLVVSQAEAGDSPRAVVLVAPSAGADDGNAEAALALTSDTLQAIQRLLPLDTVESFVLVTRGAVCPIDPSKDAAPSPAHAALWGLWRTLALEHPEIKCRRIDLDPQISVDPAALANEILCNDPEPEVVLRSGGRFVSRLIDSKEEPGLTQRRRVAVPQRRGEIEGVVLQEAPARTPGPGEVAVDVLASGLNFRDVLIALGRYPGDPPLGGEFCGTITAIGPGVEVAGVLGVGVGDLVLGIAPNSLADRVVVQASAVVPIPAGWDPTEGATLPIAFATSSLALEEGAALRPGDRVLIHAATGGVGLAALQVAASAGARVFATASRGKHHVLLGSAVEGVFDSRCPSFANALLTATGGAGVNVLLNALGEDFVEANLRALAPGGRYVDLTKPAGDVAQRIRSLRSDVAYQVIDLAALSERQPERVAALLSRTVQRVGSGELKPLPCTVWPLAEIGDALRTLQGAQHTGKLVVTPSAPLATTPSRRVTIDPQGAYVIAGGLGDLGIETARRLAIEGAGLIALVARRPPTPRQMLAIAGLERIGARVLPLVADVASPAELGAALETVRQNCLPIRGVVQAAGTLADAMLLRQTAESFRDVFGPKALGAWNLHLLTSDDPLDLFVLYGSIAGVLGSPGQANHAAANAYLDALVALRRKLGLPGLAIAWGPWEVLGEAARRGVSGRGDLAGFDPLRVRAGRLAIEELLTCGASSAFVTPLSPERMSERRRTAPVFARLDPGATLETRADASAFLTAYHAAPRFARRGLVVELLRERLARVLNRREPAGIATDAALFEMGLDSLTTLELKNSLSEALRIDTPANLIFDYPTVNQLADHLHAKLEAAPAPRPVDSDSAGSAQTPFAKEPSKQLEFAPAPSLEPASSAESSEPADLGGVLSDLSDLEAELQLWGSAR